MYCIYLFIAHCRHLSLVVDVVEVLSDARLRALALDVCSGESGGPAAGGRAAQGGQTSAAERSSPEEQHVSGRGHAVCLRQRTRTLTGGLRCFRPVVLHSRCCHRSNTPEVLQVV